MSWHRKVEGLNGELQMIGMIEKNEMDTQYMRERERERRERRRGGREGWRGKER